MPCGPRAGSCVVTPSSGTCAPRRRRSSGRAATRRRPKPSGPRCVARRGLRRRRLRLLCWRGRQRDPGVRQGAPRAAAQAAGRGRQRRGPATARAGTGASGADAAGGRPSADAPCAMYADAHVVDAAGRRGARRRSTRSSPCGAPEGRWTTTARSRSTGSASARGRHLTVRRVRVFYVFTFVFARLVRPRASVDEKPNTSEKAQKNNFAWIRGSNP